MRTRTVVVVLAFLSVATSCSSASTTTSAATSPTSIATSSSTSSPPSSIDVASLKRGEPFDLPDGEEANFTRSQDARQDSKLTISVVAILGKPGFSPAVIVGSPGQVLHVTLSQADDAS